MLGSPRVPSGVVVTVEGLLPRGRRRRGLSLIPGLEQPEVRGDLGPYGLMWETRQWEFGQLLNVAQGGGLLETVAVHLTL